MGPRAIEYETFRHIEGLFLIDTWLRLLQEAGFKAECVPDTIEPARRLFVGQRVA